MKKETKVNSRTKNTWLDDVPKTKLQRQAWKAAWIALQWLPRGDRVEDDRAEERIDSYKTLTHVSAVKHPSLVEPHSLMRSAACHGAFLGCA